MSNTEPRTQEGTVTELSDFEARPHDCECGGWNDGLELPCWPCYRDGFEEPNPDADE